VTFILENEVAPSPGITICDFLCTKVKLSHCSETVCLARLSTATLWPLQERCVTHGHGMCAGGREAEGYFRVSLADWTWGEGRTGFSVALSALVDSNDIY
jgi:hypothetical protein